MSEPENNKGQAHTHEGDRGFTAGWGSHAILITLFLVYMSDYADRFVVASMFGYIKEDWGITDAQAGDLMGVVILFITIFSLPVSMLIDRWSRRKMMSIMTLFWSMATLACAFTKNYWQLLVARAFIGIGEAGYAPAGTAMLAGAYPEKRRALVMGIWNIAIPLGMGIGLMAGGQIAARWGWQHAFGLVALPGVILAVVAWFLPDYKSVRPENSGETLVANFKSDLGTIVRIPSLVFTYLGFAMNVSLTTALATWLSVYFERTGVAEQGKGGMYATPVFALILIGAPLGGLLSDVWHKRNTEGRLYFPAVTSLIAAGVLFVAFQFPGAFFPQVPILILFGIFVTGFIAPAVSVTQDVVHPGLRAFSYAMCVIVQHLLGDVWSPSIIGRLSDAFTLEKAVMFMPVWAVLAAVCFFIASRFYVKDMERVERVQLEEEERE